ncbi:Regulatory CLIP domain of proteinase [Popillia japonica]|uniref:CLIP domain-containing serine protease n=1 Tax=Popillia japonica TaxID=7064 RepID=A0AAW1LU54_POPJA
MFCAQIIPLLLLFETIINRQLVTSQLQEDEICVTNSGKPGKCVLIEKCPAALALVRNRGRPQVCSFQGRSPIVCCENVVSRTQSIAAKKCLLYTKPNLITTESRIPEDVLTAVGGEDAEPLEFPHMAILGYGDPNDTKWLCCENFVLTAAHCIYTRYGNVAIIKLGVHQISETNMFVQTFRVKNTYQHPQYNSLLSYHDIALLELDQFADILFGVRPACLHTSKQLPSNSFTGTGWGATELYGDNSDILQKVNLSYVPTNKCARFYNRRNKLPNGLNDDWQICADGGGASGGLLNFTEITATSYRKRNKLPNGLNDDWQICADGGGARADTCQGDSGGPIQLPRDENVTDLYTIIGITSFGIKCAIVPAVYTRISYYVPWIESIVWPN